MAPQPGTITNVADATAAGAYDATNGAGAYNSYVIANKTAPTSSTPPIPPSNPDTPSSSSYLPTVGSAQTAAKNATTPTPPQTAPAYSAALQDFKDTNGFSDAQMQQYMADPDSIVSITSAYNDTNKAKTDALQSQIAEQQASAAANAKEDASYSALVTKINDAQNAALQSSQVSMYAANPYATSGSANSSRIGAIGASYATMLATANNDYTNAKAALVAGDAQSYATIMNDLDSKIADYSKTLTGNLQTNAQQTQTANYQSSDLALRTQTEQDNQQVKAQGVADKELQTIPEDTANKILALGSDPSTFSKADMATLTSTPGYNSLINAGLTPADALGYIKSAAQGNKEQATQQKITNSQADAQARLTLAQTSAALAQERYTNSLTSDADFKNSVQFSSQGIPYVDSSQYKGATAFNSARSQAAASGVAFLTPTEATQIKSITDAKSQNQSMFNQIDSYLKANNTTWESTLANKPKTVLSTLSGANSILAAYGSWWSSSVTTLKAAVGTGGNVRITTSMIDDEMKNNQVNSSDTVATANQKMLNIQTMLDNTENAILGKTAINSTSDLTTAGPVVMTGPDGKQYNVPSNQVGAFMAAGGHQ